MNKPDDTVAVEVRQLRTDQLRPNDYNPNRMTGEEFAELVEEVRHLARLPKPVVVRNGYAPGEYLIVDGEHGWRAAIEVGLGEVTCEVIEADDFEAMRQTYKRNQHGTHDRVALGQMFRRMMDERGLSNRQLAKEINVSEGTIRNALIFAEAAELRKRYAPDYGATSDDYRFTKMTTEQARSYVQLPEGIRDHWLNAGGPQIWNPETWGMSGEGVVEDLEGYLEVMVKSGIADIFKGSGSPWTDNAKRAYKLMVWRHNHHRIFGNNIDAYIRPVVEKLPINPTAVEILNAMPLHNKKPLLTPEEWAEAIRVVWDKSQTVAGVLTRFSDIAKLKAAEKGIPEDDLEDPKVALVKLEVERDAPVFIRDADLPLRVKHFFVKKANHYYDGRARVDASKLNEKELLLAKQGALRFLVQDYQRFTREFEEYKKASAAFEKHLDALGPAEAIKLIMSGEGPRYPKNPATAEDAWKAAIKVHYHQLEQAEKAAEQAELKKTFEDAEKVADAIVERFKAAAPKVFEQQVGDKRAWEVLAQRLRAVPKPELLLLGALMLKAPVGVWLEALREET